MGLRLLLHGVTQENAYLERELRRQNEILDRSSLRIESLLSECAARTFDSEEASMRMNTLMRCADAEVHIPPRELSQIFIQSRVHRATSFGCRFFDQLVAGVFSSSPLNFTPAQLFSNRGVAALIARVCSPLMQKRPGMFARSALSVSAR